MSTLQRKRLSHVRHFRVGNPGLIGLSVTVSYLD